MLREFHASHYHPSQAIFMTAGSVPAAEIQARIADRVLSRIRGRMPPCMPQKVTGWKSPRRAEILVPSQEARPDEFGIQLAWLMGESSDPKSATEAVLLMNGLLGDASAPVMKVMQSAGFGRPSQMNGSSDEARQIVFHLGMEGLTVAQVEPAHALIRDALARTAEVGVPQSTLQAALRDLRFEQREIRGGGTPDGLSRLLSAVPVLMYGGDVLTAFENDALLDELERKVADPSYFKQLVSDLIDNPSCLITQVVPDAQFFAKRDAIEAAQLAERATQMSEHDWLKIQEENEALEAWQNRAQDTSVLPRIRPGDVSPDAKSLTALHAPQGDAVAASIPSNGIVYVDLFFDVGRLPESDWPWLALYAQLAPQLGVGERGYAEASAWLQSLVPRFSMSFEAQGRPEQFVPTLRYHASGLREGQEAINQVLQAWTIGVRFDESERIRFLIESSIEKRLNHLSESGSQYAMLAATAPISDKRRFLDVIGGKAYLPFCATLRSMLASADGVEPIATKLKQLHARVVASPRTVLCSGLPGDGDNLAKLLSMPRVLANEASTAKPRNEAAQRANVALLISSQVNHCAIAWAAPQMSNEDAPALAVAAELLTNTILHQSLREKGGAYGGSASYSDEDGIFALSSYRDPRLAETYTDFQIALDRMLIEDFSDDALEEAKICVIKRLDKPLSPYLEAMRSWTLQRRGVTAEHRQAFRQGMLGCSLAQVRNAVRRWLVQGAPSRAAAVGSKDRDLSGLLPVDLLAMAS